MAALRKKKFENFPAGWAFFLGLPHPDKTVCQVVAASTMNLGLLPFRAEAIERAQILAMA